MTATRARIEIGDYPKFGKAGEKSDDFIRVFDLADKKELLQLIDEYVKDTDGFVSVSVRPNWKE